MEKGYVFYSAAFIILSCLGSSADDVMMYHYSSTYGVLCSNTCGKYGEDYYWCETREGWDYCSPAQNRDYKDNACRDPCDKHDKDYYWCNSNGGSSYCGPVELKRTVYLSSTYQQVCIDDCAHDRSYDHYWYVKDYYWCNTRKGWDYCSPAKNRDYENDACRDDHPCDKHGESYYWCYTDGWFSGWGYCGPVEPNTAVYISSTYKSVCFHDCLYDEDHEYYWCYTDKGWDYCSPTPAVTY